MIQSLIDNLYNFLVYTPEKPLIYTRYAFWLFFTVVIGVYALFFKKTRIRNSYLLLISLFFYYKTGGWFVLLLVFSCLSNYGFGFLIHHIKKGRLKLLVLWLGIGVNLFLLAYFKYAYFFTSVVNGLTGDAYETYNWLAQWWNQVSNSSIATLDIILPVGISFFTFQAISYLVDVYRARTKVVKNIFDFSFYLSFFPQLVAGPIVRAEEFIPQLYQPYVISKREFGHALFLILSGLLKKIVLSDFIAVNFIDRVFSQPGAFSGVENLFGIYAYALQIYADFSGYTDIAIGVALLLGFKLPLNFNSPYKSLSLTEFWHRWHISLSTWLRDYLYIPLGGNRKGKIRTLVNLMVTMILGGLWHGANIKFVAWGALHGAGLVVEKVSGSYFKRKPSNAFRKGMRIFFTFHIVLAGWLLFRVNSMADAGAMLQQIYYTFQLADIWRLAANYPLLVGLVVAGFVVHMLPVKWQEMVRGHFIESPIWMKGIITLIVLYILNVFILLDIQPFIYFRF